MELQVARGLGVPPPPMVMLLTVMVMLCALGAAGKLEVEMAERMQVVSLRNITIPCKIPGSPHLNISTVGILWFWRKTKTEVEVPVFEFYGNHQAVFRSGATVPPRRLEWGDASLHLPEIQLGEAGDYLCKLVVTPQVAEGTTRLEVVAPPAITLFVEQAMATNQEESHIVCNLCGFFPENISIKWEKRTPKDLNFQNITEDVVTGATVKNEDGTFNVTSYLKVKPAVEDCGIIYQCVVSHRSLHTSQSFNITLPTNAGSVKTDTLWRDLLLGLLVILSIVMGFGIECWNATQFPLGMLMRIPTYLPVPVVIQE